MRIACFLLGLFLFGCVSENSRELLAQSQEAAQVIVGSSVSPEIKEVASDVVNNIGSVLDVVGRPEISRPYSSGASSALRAQAQQEAASGGVFSWLGSVVTALPFPWAAAAGSLLTAVFAFRRRGALSDRLKNLMVSVDGAMENLTPEAREQVVTTLRDSAVASGDYLQNKSDLAELRGTKKVSA
jgi:hypothetical protein